MTDDDFNAFMLFADLELDAARSFIAAFDELEALAEAGREAGGHWGPESERFAELVETVAARQAFPPTAWWQRA